MLLIIRVLLGTVNNQKELWRQTVDDSHEAEEASRNGGETPLKISPKLVHDVQLLVSRLAAKANQLIGNHTTNLTKAWMHIRCKSDGGKVINRSQALLPELACPRHGKGGIREPFEASN